MYEHFKGEEQFVKAVLTYIDQVLYKQKIIVTKFLNPRHQDIIKNLVGKNPDIQVLFSGGIEDAESQKCILAPSYFIIDKEDFEVTVVKVKYPSQFEKIGHKDILGALMSLGVKRELFGDIVCYEGDFYIALDTTMVSYVRDNCKKIKRATIHFLEVDEVVKKKQEYTVRTVIASSMRLDKMVAALYKLSRAKAVTFVQAGHVKVNHKMVDESSYLCNNNDIISLKRHGRVMIVITERKTKADNCVVEGYYYK